MKNFRLGTFIAGALVIGGTMFVSSTFAGTDNNAALTVIRHNNTNAGVKAVVEHAAVHRSAGVIDNKVVLIAPPSELPLAPSTKMVTSTKAFAPNPRTAVIPAQKTASAKNKATASPAKASEETAVCKVVSAKAPAQKTEIKNLFTLVRMLNYSPHPLNEDLLKHSPLALNGNNYWFTVKYDEDWNVLNDEEAYMKGISFEIEVMENNQKVRSLKTPKAAINPAKIKKGQVLGIAEVAPYKFTISVEEFTKTKKGISELVFKLDLLG